MDSPGVRFRHGLSGRAEDAGWPPGPQAARSESPSQASSALPSNREKAHTGFEPVLPMQALDDPLRRKLAHLRALPVVLDPRSRA
jgi:hypothetical protein